MTPAFHLRPSTGVLFASLASGLLVAGCAGGPGWMSSPASTGAASGASAPRPAPLDASAVGASRVVPAALRTPVGQSLFLLVSGTGVQIYECGAGAGGTYRWTVRSPEATLVDASGASVGKHGSGPTWESTDGSTVTGTVAASDPGPDATAAPWLLLTVASTTGSGVFTQTRSIQRLQTVGGGVPASTCGTGIAGQTVRVPYAATYAFFRAGS